MEPTNLQNESAVCSCRGRQVTQVVARIKRGGKVISETRYTTECVCARHNPSPIAALHVK